ncbi:MAG: DUF1489 domain-containing protein [Pseudomonadota bacterium]|nr:DUF1489 domain-containing protein [Pseudomonadota bacterium]
MPLHLTKVAFGANGVEDLAESLLRRAAAGPVFLTTRYLPKRHEEIAGAKGEGGSLFWILKHTLIARSPILSFGDAEGGKVAINLDPHLILTQGRPKRAHQGWRYLDAADAPADLGEGVAGDALPAALIGKLSALGLV